MNSKELKNLNDELKECFLNAGERAMHLRDLGLKTEVKNDNTPVTNGDLEVNEILTNKIKELTPSIPSIHRFKLMNAAHSEEIIFTVKTHGTDLIFSFGDSSSHAGQFVFQDNIKGSLKRDLCWPIAEIQSIFNLNGDMTMSLSNDGVMKLSVDSGLAQYDYFCPAQVK